MSETATATQDFKVADLSLADYGRKEIRLAEHEMPGLMATRREFAESRPLAGEGSVVVEQGNRQEKLDGSGKAAIRKCSGREEPACQKAQGHLHPARDRTRPKDT